MQGSPFVRLSQRMDADLLGAVGCILQDQQRGVEKHLLCLRHRDAMLVFAFAGIASVPIEAADLGKINHFCILPSHTLLVSSAAGAHSLEDVVQVLDFAHLIEEGFSVLQPQYFGQCSHSPVPNAT